MKGIVNNSIRAIVIDLFAICALVQAQNNSQGVIIQALTPTEAAWKTQYDTLDEVWNDCFLVYEMLCAKPAIDTNQDKIHMLWADTADYFRQGERYNPLEKLRIRRITDDSACVFTVESTFKAIAPLLGPEDTLFCYTWGHGGSDHPTSGSKASHFFLQVRPIILNAQGTFGDSIWDTTFARMVDTIHSKRVFIMQQCYSGGFMDDLADSNTIILCATAMGKKAHPCDDASKNGSPLPEHEVDGGLTWRHSEFNFHILNALRGKAIWSPPNGYESPVTVNADTNGEGIVSWFEAFRYNEMYNSIPRTREYPVYFDPFTEWMIKASVPGPKKVRKGAALTTFEGDTTILPTTIFAFKGGNCEFWAYNIDGDSSVAQESIPAISRSGANRKVKDGSTLAAASNGVIYATKGGCNEFWGYNPSVNQWQEKESVPGVQVKRGAAATAVLVESQPFVYLLKGNNTCEFWRYNPQEDHWDRMADAPTGSSGRGYKNGSCLTWDGNSTIYLLKGKYNEFYAYNIPQNTWTTNSSLPFYGRSRKNWKAKDGAGLAYCGGRLYATKGGNKCEFWVYKCESNNWFQATDVPLAPGGKGVGAGGSITFAENYLWVLKGKYKFDFLRFSPNRGLTPQGEPQPIPPSPVEALVASGEDAGHPRWSPSVEWVAFSKPDSNGNLQIWMAQTDGNEERQLTSLNGDCECPVWSPDESRITFLFTPVCSPYSQIGVVDTSGMVSFLTADSCDKEYPDWSPDGALIAYQADDTSGFTQIYTISANGGASTQWTSEPVDHEKPKFSSSGSIIYQREGTNGLSQIYRLDLSSSQENQVTFSDADHENPAVAVDAGLVVFEVTGVNGFSQIGIVSVGGGAEQVLTGGEHDFTDPSISDDGGTVHCVRWGTTGSAICLVNSDGGYELLIDDEVDRENPHTTPVVAFSPAAVYVRPDGVYRTGIQQRSGSQNAGCAAINLEQALPNPARERVWIKYSLPEETEVSLKVYNSAGELMRTLVSRRLKPGQYSTVWDGKDTRGRKVGAGVYFYQLETKEKRLSQKLVLTQ